jgi:AraC-like DNA-binding protein/quercetin dioxygenase-like cupin family protein
VVPGDLAHDFEWATSRALRVSERGELILPWSPDLPVRLLAITFTPSHRLAPSVHRFLEITLVDSGEGEFVIENERYSVSAGCLILIGPGEFHRLMARQGSMVRAISLHFDETFIARPSGHSQDKELLKSFYLSDHRLRRLISLDENLASDALLTLTQIDEELHAGRSDSALAVRTYLQGFLFRLSRKLHALSPNPSYRGWDSTHHADMAPVIEFLQREYSHTIRLEKLARMACLSPGHFCRRFKQTTGSTYLEYVHRLRIDRAMDLLIDGQSGTAEIAAELGYSSQSHFNRMFKRYVGQAPVEFRRSYLKS